MPNGRARFEATFAAGGELRCACACQIGLRHFSRYRLLAPPLACLWSLLANIWDLGACRVGFPGDGCVGGAGYCRCNQQLPLYKIATCERCYLPSLQFATGLTAPGKEAVLGRRAAQPDPARPSSWPRLTAPRRGQSRGGERCRHWRKRSGGGGTAAGFCWVQSLLLSDLWSVCKTLLFVRPHGTSQGHSRRSRDFLRNAGVHRKHPGS